MAHGDTRGGAGESLLAQPADSVVMVEVFSHRVLHVVQTRRVEEPLFLSPQAGYRKTSSFIAPAEFVPRKRRMLFT